MAYRRLLTVVRSSPRTDALNGARRYSEKSGNGAGKGKGTSEKPPSSSGGFFKNFMENFKRSVKDDEMQESLKSFHEEREKMQQSYVVQQAKQKLKDFREGAGVVGEKGAEMSSEGWTKVKSATSKAYDQATETELGKKTQEVGAKVVKDIQKTAEALSKTEVAEAVKKGTEIVREDLVDDIVKQSNPYRAPEKIMKRSELTSANQPSARVIAPNEDAKGLVKTKKDASWKDTWDKWREDNPISNLYYSARIKYDESDNILIRASRSVTDRMGDLVRGSMSQTDMGEALAEIRKVDPNFDTHEFLEQCKEDIIPPVLEAYMHGMEDVLKDWCHEPAFNVLSQIIKQRHEPGVKLECKVLDIRDLDIAVAKVLDQGPVMVITFHAQQLTRKQEGSSFSELLENVVYVWALCRDQTIYDPRSAWRVLEFGIQFSGKMLA